MLMLYCRALYVNIDEEYEVCCPFSVLYSLSIVLGGRGTAELFPALDAKVHVLCIFMHI